MKHVLENYVLNKDLVTLVCDAYLQAYGTNADYRYPGRVRNSYMMLNDQDSPLAIKRLTK